MEGNTEVKLVLKGLHRVSRKLASGKTNVHYYAWRGGPKMTAVPGTPAFVAEFAALTAERDKPHKHGNTFQDLINAYQQDPVFQNLSAATRKGYVQRIRRIEEKFGSVPIKVLNDPRIRDDFLAWRTQIAKDSGPREADYRIAVMARILSWAHHHRKILENHLQRPARVHKGSRVEYVWHDEAIDSFRAVAGAHVDLPFTLGLETGQREANILDLRWSNYDGTYMRLRQTKTGRNVVIPLLAETRSRLDQLRVGRQPHDHICLNSRGEPWTMDGFKSSFGKAKKAAGITNLTFHDTRGTAVVNLARAGSTVPEIVSITGHSLRDAENILSAHYLSTDRELSDSAIRKLEEYHAAKRAKSAGSVAQV